MKKIEIKRSRKKLLNSMLFILVVIIILTLSQYLMKPNWILLVILIFLSIITLFTMLIKIYTPPLEVLKDYESEIVITIDDQGVIYHPKSNEIIAWSSISNIKKQWIYGIFLKNINEQKVYIDCYMLEMNRNEIFERIKKHLTNRCT